MASRPPSPPPAPPKIFAAHRRAGAAARRARLQASLADPARFLIGDMVEDVLERLAFLRHVPARALVIGDWTGTLAAALADTPAPTPAPPAAQIVQLAADGFDPEAPLPEGGFDFIANLAALDTVNDLPGALIHLRHALAPGGLMIAGLPGAGSLPALRAALLAADAERPAARLHPMVDVRAGAQLLQRAGFVRPVADGHRLTVRYGALSRLVNDLRAMGLTNALASAPPALTRRGWQRAQAAFAERADADGRTPETFEVLMLSGWAPPARG